jgi:cytochrome b6-f complex iron-sulfur subunit
MDLERTATDRTANSHQLLGRRGAIGRLGGFLAALFAAIRVSFAQRRLALSLDKVEKLKTPGGAALLKIERREILFVRESEERVCAFNPTCTHKQCTVEYSKDKRRLVCPCHGSNYDLSGKVLNGPAEKPLQVYDAALDSANNRIILTVEES